MNFLENLVAENTEGFNLNIVGDPGGKGAEIGALTSKKSFNC